MPAHEPPEGRSDAPPESRVIAAITINRLIYADGTLHTHVYADDTEDDYLDTITSLGMLRAAEHIVLNGGDE